ncbi:MAG TPA: hypothetical protein VGK20_01465 [Candidatus Binatia bacterium]|jgi:hypothetical protein
MSKFFKIACACALASTVVFATTEICHAGSVCLQAGSVTYTCSGIPKKGLKVFACHNDVNIPSVASGFVDGSGNRIMGITET